MKARAGKFEILYSMLTVFFNTAEARLQALSRKQSRITAAKGSDFHRDTYCP